MEFEDIFEMALVYNQIIDELEDDIDSTDVKHDILDWAKEFEEKYPIDTWDENDMNYYDVIKSFTKDKLLDKYGKTKEYTVGFSANVIVNAKSESDAIKIARKILDSMEFEYIKIIYSTSI